MRQLLAIADVRQRSSWCRPRRGPRFAPSKIDRAGGRKRFEGAQLIWPACCSITHG